MKHIIRNRINYWLIGVFFLSVSLFSLTMDVPFKPKSAIEKTCVLPEKTIELVDMKKAVENYQTLAEVIPGNMVITPNGNAVITGHNGNVFLYDLLCPFGINKKHIFSHPCVKHSPMIELAQKGNDLLIVSAGNYVDLENGNKRLSEYIECCLSATGETKSYIIKHLDGPTQSIKLDCYGKLLAIAGKDKFNNNQVQVIELKTGEMDRVIFRNTLAPTARLVDVAINPAGDFVIAVDNAKCIRLMTLSLVNGPCLSGIQEAVIQDHVRRVHYPNQKELMVETLAGEINIIHIYELVEPYQEVHDERRNQLVCQRKTIGKTFSAISPYDLVAVDPGAQIAIAHWTNKIDSQNNSNHFVKVYRRIDSKGSVDKIEKFTLYVPHLEERYEYITHLGQIGYELGHLVYVAIRGQRVVVLRTDGKMSIYSLDHEDLKRKVLPLEILLSVSRSNVPKASHQQKSKRNSLSQENEKSKKRYSHPPSAPESPRQAQENMPKSKNAATHRRATIGGDNPKSEKGVVQKKALDDYHSAVIYSKANNMAHSASSISHSSMSPKKEISEKSGNRRVFEHSPYNSDRGKSVLHNIARASLPAVGQVGNGSLAEKLHDENVQLTAMVGARKHLERKKSTTQLQILEEEKSGLNRSKDDATPREDKD